MIDYESKPIGLGHQCVSQNNEFLKTKLDVSLAFCRGSKIFCQYFLNKVWKRTTGIERTFPIVISGMNSGVLQFNY